MNDGNCSDEDRLRSINDELSSRPDLLRKSSPWLPLESNPDIFTSFARRVGMLPDEWAFLDVLGVDSETLSSVPRPVAAVILLFPCTERIYVFRAEEQRRLLRGQSAASTAAARAAYHVKQVASFGNACGTIAAVHALTNAGLASERSIGSDGASAAFPRIGGPVAAFRDKTTDGMTAEERGRVLVSSGVLHYESDAAASDTTAQTECPDRGDTKLGHHYCAFVPVESDAEGTSGTGSCATKKELRLVELDGTKVAPIDHGPIGSGSSSGLDFLEATAALVRERWMGLEPDRIDFSLMALCRIG